MSAQRDQLAMEPCGDSAAEAATGSAVARKLLAALELVVATVFATILAVTALRRRRKEPLRSLQGCKVLITGADSNFGCSLVSHFSQHGCRVARVVRPCTNNTIKTELTTCRMNDNRNHSDVFICDIREPSQLPQLALSVKERFDRIDILVCQSVIKETESDCRDGLESIARLVNSEVKTHLSILQNMIPLVEEKTGLVVTIPTNTKHSSTVFRDTQEALVDLMTTMADQMAQSHGVALTRARFQDNGKKNDDSAAAHRLIKAIQNRRHFCDLSCNKFQEIIQTSFAFLIKVFWRNGKEEIKPH